MANVSPHRRHSSSRRRVKCTHSCPKTIYDEPYAFHVRTDRSITYSSPCRACLREAKQRQLLAANNIQYEKRCSRLPLRPMDKEHMKRPKTVASIRRSDECNWNNFMKRRSKYAIRSPYAECNLRNYERDVENRPPFVNYGGFYHDKSSGQKRTYNSLAIHQLKHDELDHERVRSVLRERRLRREAENYFRGQNFYDQYARSPDEYRYRNSRSSQN